MVSSTYEGAWPRPHHTAAVGGAGFPEGTPEPWRWGGRALDSKPRHHSARQPLFPLPSMLTFLHWGRRASGSSRESGGSKGFNFSLLYRDFSLGNLDQVTAEMADVFLAHKTGWPKGGEKPTRHGGHQESRREGQEGPEDWAQGSAWLQRSERGGAGCREGPGSNGQDGVSLSVAGGPEHWVHRCDLDDPMLPGWLRE